MLVAAHLSRKLKLIAVRRDIHLTSWHLKVRHLAPRQHAHIDILLMCGG
jgi:hypothetical protein